MPCRLTGWRGAPLQSRACLHPGAQAQEHLALPNGAAWINPTGNAGMATGGTGDILTGMFAGMLRSSPGPGDSPLRRRVSARHGRRRGFESNGRWRLLRLTCCVPFRKRCGAPSPGRARSCSASRRRLRKNCSLRCHPERSEGSAVLRVLKIKQILRSPAPTSQPQARRGPQQNRRNLRMTLLRVFQQPARTCTFQISDWKRRIAVLKSKRCGRHGRFLI